MYFFVNVLLMENCDQQLWREKVSQQHRLNRYQECRFLLVLPFASQEITSARMRLRSRAEPCARYCPVQALCPISWRAHRILTFLWCHFALRGISPRMRKWYLSASTFLHTEFSLCVCESKIRTINTFANEPKPPACFQVSQHSAFLMTRIVLTCARVRAQWEVFLLYHWFPEPSLSHWFGRFNSWCVNAGEAIVGQSVCYFQT